MQQLQIPFGSLITLKSRYTQKYLGFKHQPQTLNAQFFHPRIHNHLPKSQPFDISLKLKIVPRQPEKVQDRPQPVTEGSRVYLISATTDEYLTSTSKGELKFDKKSMNEQMNKMLFKSATWTLSYASTQKSLSSPSKNPLSPFDAIVLKSVLGNYLTVQQNAFVCQAVLEMDDQRSVWFIELAQERRYPQWVYQRPTFSKFLMPQLPQVVGMEKRSLRSNPPELQEALLVEDILDVSFGFEGTYIKRRPGSCLFAIEPHIQSSNNSSIALYQLTYRILELTSHYEKLMGFIKKLEISEGVLVQALGDGLRKIAAQYYQQIVQLDELAAQGLTLQKMWVQIQDSLKVMKALGDLVVSAKDLKGGQLLSCLQKLINETTDGFVLNIYKHILERLITIYVGMLSKWIYEGIIEDRYGEFMIKIEERATGEWNNWQQRFTLRAQQVPSLLERDQEKVLVTGKYLNILKACNRKIHCPFSKDIEQNIEYHISRQNFTEPIQRAYEWANQQLLQLVFGEYKLIQILTSLKGYYFLQFGDLFVHFLDAAEEDLYAQKVPKLDMKSKPFSVQKLQNLFELTVRTSSAANDDCKEQVTCRLDTATVFEQVHRIKTLESQVFEFDFSEKPFLKKDPKYVDFLTLDFKCEFPLNLILNKKSLSKYQALFRLMIWCKFLERQIGSCWMKLQELKEMRAMDMLKPVYKINHRIHTFLKSIVYYFSEEVIQQNWFKLEAGLKKAQNFEEIIQCHDQFLNKCLKQALLTNARLLPLLTSDIGASIYNYISHQKNILQRFQNQFNAIKQNCRKPTKPSEYNQFIKYVHNRIEEEAHQNKTNSIDTLFSQILTKTLEAFEGGLTAFIREISQSTKKEQDHLVRLSEMLDEQNFLSKAGSMFRGDNRKFYM